MCSSVLYITQNFGYLKNCFAIKNVKAVFSIIFFEQYAIGLICYASKLLLGYHVPIGH